MPDNLEKLSLEKLGQLFPIIICEYNPEWKRLYLSEESTIKLALGSEIILRINHYGSTCVPNLYSKPTIDILLEIREGTDTEKVISSLKGVGYLFTPQPDNPAPHMMFMKGYTPNGFAGQAYHVHVRYGGDWDELYFRDYLILHPNVAEEYGDLKIQLMGKFEHDREAYTRGKTKFIKRITLQARKELGEKY